MIKQLQTSVAILSLFASLNLAQASEALMAPVVGGDLVSTGQTIARRTVALFFIGQDGKEGLCTGSILDNAHVITAAHCVQNFKQGLVIFATGGVMSLVKNAAAHGLSSVPQARLMSSAVAQPGYSGQQSGSNEFNDLAIISFNGGLVPGYEPAKFLTQAAADQSLTQGASVTLAGFGMTFAPARSATGAELPSKGNNGTGTLRQVSVNFKSIGPKRIDIYVGGRSGHNACSGDSGGPAMIQVSGETYVIGVDSRGDCDTMSIYTFVDHEKISNLKLNLNFASN